MIPKSEVLDTLFGIRDALSDMIIALSPTNANEAAELAQLVARRDRITGSINFLIAAAFNEAAAGLAAPFADLEAKTAQLKSLNQTLANIATAIQVADQIVQIAATIATIAAG